MESLDHEQSSARGQPRRLYDTQKRVMRALVVGAGLGGLPAALKLHARGIETLVFESVSEIGALGVGIAFCPRARAS